LRPFGGMSQTDDLMLFGILGAVSKKKLINGVVSRP